MHCVSSLLPRPLPLEDSAWGRSARMARGAQGAGNAVKKAGCGQESFHVLFPELRWFMRCEQTCTSKSPSAL